MQRGTLFLLFAAVFPSFAYLSDIKDDYDMCIDTLLDFDDQITVDFNIDFDFSNGATSTPVGLTDKKESSEEQEIVLNENANSAGRFGIHNDASLFVCYMNAFLTAVFNIHAFRKAVYECEPRNASTAALAITFANLQTAKQTVHTDKFLLPAVRKDLSWTTGGFECNMEFGNRFLDILPASVKSLFNISLRSQFFLEDSGKLIRTDDATDNHIIIPPNLYKSISSAIENHFSYHEAQDYIIERGDLGAYAGLIEPFEEPKRSFKVHSKVSIINRPEMLVFGIRRHLYTSEFIESPVELDDEIVLPGLAGEAPVKYLLLSFCYHVPNHYISYVRDFTRGTPEGDWYKYDDYRVSAVRTISDYESLKRSADNAATLAFYVRSDSVMTRENNRPIEIPIRYNRLNNVLQTFDEANDRRAEIENTKRTPSTRKPLQIHPEINENYFESIHHPSDSEMKQRSRILPSPVGDIFRRHYFPRDADYSANGERRVPEA